jgi:hypothetical protein
MIKNAIIAYISKAREDSCSYVTRDTPYLVQQDDKWLHIQQSRRKINRVETSISYDICRNVSFVLYCIVLH